MIQRKQTLYLLLAIVLSMVCLSLPVAEIQGDGFDDNMLMTNLFITTGGEEHISMAPWPMFVLLIATIPVALASVFLYRRRRLQASLCVFCILLLLAWYIVAAVIIYNLQALDSGTLSPRWTAALPAVCIILYILARRGIMADEKLVRSLDRIR